MPSCDSGSVAAAIASERYSAQEQRRDVVWIRVTPEALEGSIVTVPVSPERARQIKLHLYEEAGGYSSGVDAAPELLARPPLEILVHPTDWARSSWDATYSEGLIQEYRGIRVVK